MQLSVLFDNSDLILCPSADRVFERLEAECGVDVIVIANLVKMKTYVACSGWFLAWLVLCARKINPQKF
jgi:hypothetical protein